MSRLAPMWQQSGEIEELNCVLTSGSVTQVGYLINEKKY